MAKSIEILLRNNQTVFTVSDLAFLWNIKDENVLKSKVYYLVKKKKIKRIHQGIFVLDNDYNKFELAGKLKKPSYVSLETILRQEGIIFQYSEEITSVSNFNRKYKIGRIIYSYRKIKDEVLLNSAGIIQKDTFSVASRERAFLDMIYLNKDYYFDNLSDIDWEKCEKLVKIYHNQNLESRLKKYAGQK